MTKRIWLAGLAVYVMAVAGRTSFGVASIEAMDRFSATSAELSLFVVIQLAVYAIAQIPVGLCLDRWGSRPVLVTGAIALGVGQVALALATTLPVALGARVLIGMGDATAFASVLRLIPQWFEPRQIPLYTQLTSIAGQFGQVISSLPFAYALAEWGWQGAFLGLGVCGALLGVCAGAIVREKDDTSRDRTTQVSVATKHPGTWLGFWTHFLLGFPGTVFTLMWGVPMMVANGITSSQAAGLLVISSATNILAGPVIARFCARHPLRRSWLVLAILGLVVAAWAYLLLKSDPGIGDFILIIIVTAIAGSGSVIGFDFARTFIPLSRLGTANGVINQGGFYATVLASFLIGVVLDMYGATSADGFRYAMASQGVIIACGLVGFLLSRRSTRAVMAREGTVVPPVADVVRRLIRDHRARR